MLLTGLKLALVDMYTRRLRERARRKRMIRDYQLVSKFFKKEKVSSRPNGIAIENGTNTKESFKGQFAAYERHAYYMTLLDKFLFTDNDYIPIFNMHI